MGREYWRLIATECGTRIRPARAAVNYAVCIRNPLQQSGLDVTEFGQFIAHLTPQQ